MFERGVKRPFSVRSRIVVLVTCTTVLLLAAVAFFLFKVFQNNQRREHARFLTSKLQYIRSEIQGSHREDASELEALNEVREVIDTENATRRSGKVMVEVSMRDGLPLMRVTGSESFFDAQPPFPPAATRVRTAVFRYWEAPSGQHFVLSSVTVNTKTSTRLVRVALDWSAEEDLIEDFSRKAAMALLLGTIASALLAATIARRALRPLEKLADAARTMDVTRLAEPLKVEMWPAELADVGAAFIEMQRTLSASFQRLSQFSADLAHELRTPISNAMGEAEVALSRARTTEEYREVIASLHEELGRLARITEELLFLARSERASNALNPTSFDAREEALSVCEYYAISAEEKTVELSVEGAASIRADRDLVRRALSNLLANAIHFTPRGGRVTVKLRENPDHVEMSVLDTGIGIADENQRKIFDRFFRADDARGNHADGSGLGLAIVQSILDMHGGKISVSSAPGKGSLFTLIFPSATDITKM